MVGRIPRIRSIQEELTQEVAVLRDTLVLRGGECRAILEVAGVPLESLPKNRQEDSLHALHALLQGLAFPVQFVVRSDPVDLTALAREVEVLDEGPLALAYAEYLRLVSTDRSILRRRCFAVVPADEHLGWWEASRQLAQRTGFVTGALRKAGMPARRLDTADLYETLGAWWIPGGPSSWSERAGPAPTPATEAAVLLPGLRSHSPLARLRNRLPRFMGRFRVALPDTPAEDTATLDELRYAAESLPDFLAPAVVETTTWTLRRGSHGDVKEVGRVLRVTGLPRTLTLAWLTPLLTLPETIDVALFLVPKPKARVVGDLNLRLSRLKAAARPVERGEKIADPDVEIAIADIERTRASLTKNQESLFDQAMYLHLRAPTEDALTLLTRRVESELAQRGVTARACPYQQLPGFWTCLPEGNDRLKANVMVDTSSAVRSFPLVVATESGRGVLLGSDREGTGPVLHDCFDATAENANLAILAPAGSGKSYAAKLLLARHRFLGADAIVIDPEGEYRALCRVLDGQLVRFTLRGGGARINPFDLPPVDTDPDTGEESDPVTEQTRFVVGLVSTMLGGLTDADRALVDTVVTGLYTTYAPNRSPVLADLQEELAHVAPHLAPRLAPWVTGSLRGLFNGPTNVSLDNRFVLFDVRDVATADDPAVVPACMKVATSYVWNAIRRERRKRLLVVDEAVTILSDPSGARFLGEMARRARKHWLGLVTMVQRLDSLTESPAGLDVLANAATKLVLKHGADAVDPVVERFDLSPEERADLIACDRGEGLLIGRGLRRKVRVLASPAEHRAVTTRPDEVAALS